jgi:serine/threonine-protein kinase
MNSVHTHTLDVYIGEAPLVVSDAVRIARQVAEAIEAAARNGATYCNLEPSKIVLSRNVRNQLQARVEGLDDPQSGAPARADEDTIASGSLINATRYLSPEECLGDNCDARSNLYSLGVMLYAMLAGRLPFDADSVGGLVEQKTKESPPPLSDEFRSGALQPLGSFVMQLLQKNPAARPPVSEVARSLRYLEYLTAQMTQASDLHPIIPVPNEPTQPRRADEEKPPAQAEVENDAALEFASPLVASAAANVSDDAPAAPPPETPVSSLNALPEKTEDGTEMTLDGIKNKVDVGAAKNLAPVAASSFSGNATDQSEVPTPKISRTQVLIAEPQRPTRTRRLAIIVGVTLIAGLLAFAATTWWVARQTSSPPSQIAVNVPVSSAPNNASSSSPAQNSAISGNSPVAEPSTANVNSSPPKQDEIFTPQFGSRSASVRASDPVVLRGNVNAWIAATNARDVNKQLAFYMPRLNFFYRARNVSLAAVRAEKIRALQQANAINISISEPEITLSDDGRTAIMRFRKQYVFAGRRGNRRGEVVQELRWLKTDSGWKIIGERDVQVIR